MVCIGCVNIPLREIPSTGVEAWYTLDARSQRSSVQGRIRLRLWLSAREAGRHDDDNWQQVRGLYHTYLNMMLLSALWARNLYAHACIATTKEMYIHTFGSRSQLESIS